ncbi:hypothetical protein JZ751_019892, partial [Albula glossodonta]
MATDSEAALKLADGLNQMQSKGELSSYLENTRPDPVELLGERVVERGGGLRIALPQETLGRVAVRPLTCSEDGSGGGGSGGAGGGSLLGDAWPSPGTICSSPSATSPLPPPLLLLPLQLLEMVLSSRSELRFLSGPGPPSEYFPLRPRTQKATYRSTTVSTKDSPLSTVWNSGPEGRWASGGKRGPWVGLVEGGSVMRGGVGDMGGNQGDTDLILHGEASVFAALLRSGSDEQQAVRAHAVTRIQAVALELAAVQCPLRGGQIGAELTLQEHVVPLHDRAHAGGHHIWGEDTETESVQHCA